MEDLIYSCDTQEASYFYVPGHVARRSIVGDALNDHDLSMEFDITAQEIFKWPYARGYLYWESASDGEWCEGDLIARFSDVEVPDSEPVTWLYMR